MEPLSWTVIISLIARYGMEYTMALLERRAQDKDVAGDGSREFLVGLKTKALTYDQHIEAAQERAEGVTP